LIARFSVGFFQVLVLSTVLACGGAAQDVTREETEVTGLMNRVDLKSQAKAISSHLDALSRSLSSDSMDDSASRMPALRESVKELNANAATAAIPQTTPNIARAEQSAPPSKVVRPSDKPPTEDEIAALERAVERTHLPGPPLPESEDADENGPLPLRVQKATTSVLVFLDQAEEAIREDDPDAARVALARAQELIDALHSSMP
jgi:hypothetical protein